MNAGRIAREAALKSSEQADDGIEGWGTFYRKAGGCAQKAGEI